jgi:hypothetical protein
MEKFRDSLDQYFTLVEELHMSGHNQTIEDFETKKNERKPTMSMNNEDIMGLVREFGKKMGMNTINVIDNDKNLIFSEYWFISLPEDQAGYVHIGFWDDMNANRAAEIAINFCKLFDAANIKVFVDYDSTFSYWPALIF